MVFLYDAVQVQTLFLSELGPWLGWSFTYSRDPECLKLNNHEIKRNATLKKYQIRLTTRNRCRDNSVVMIKLRTMSIFTTTTPHRLAMAASALLIEVEVYFAYIGTSSANKRCSEPSARSKQKHHVISRRPGDL
jgi:hypothetical protein